IRSPFIDQIVVLGQDQRSLGALIVPNLEALQQWAATQNAALQFPTPPSIDPLPKPSPGVTAWTLEAQPIQDLFRKELAREVQSRVGYRPDDRIGSFGFALEPFSLENGMLTQTLKIKRSVVMDHYHSEIANLFR
ncbi:MAG: long-chain fatty acid--CoA ligase, partial [Acaryochloridaceae cyanobacterium CSU_5_19]|nr:long-chain fatty acid--CoA ligase [Acaryochloridaceae cyanobacterium CSU_5_19]